MYDLWRYKIANSFMLVLAGSALFRGKVTSFKFEERETILLTVTITSVPFSYVAECQK